MNIKKSKMALLIGASLFLTMPLSSTFADQKQHETHEMHMGNMMQNIKDELRGYVKAVKSDDTQTMQQHVDMLLKLTTMPAMDHATMDHSKMPMDHTGMTDEAIANMDHSKMDHSKMPMDHTGMTDEAIANMDHSKMDHSNMKMDHKNMGHDMSNMEEMSTEQHQHMMHMQEMTQFHDLFKSLDNVTDKAEISATLGKIKEQLKKNNG